MKVRYQFVTGDATEVEATGVVADELCSMIDEERNRERAETRRHVSYDALREEGAQFAGDANTEEEAIQRLNLEVLRAALSGLTPSEKRLVEMVHFEGQSVSSIARRAGVAESTIRRKLNRIHEHIVKFYFAGPN